MTTNRQLAAIMFTDIVGYTSLMGRDERKALQLIKTNRNVHKKFIKQFNGNWLKEMGDGILASFPTISDAVYCAGAIQNAVAEMVDLELRIGIHVGEIVVENGDVFGDGVNIASRIEALASPREIWVSESVYRNIKNKEGINLSFIRDETLKNVDEPVKIYSVDVSKEFQASLTKTGNSSTEGPRRFLKPIAMVVGVMIVLLLAVNILYFTPGGQTNASIVDKSIAVLPFKNMTSDQDNNFFSDGMMEAILNNLSKVSDLRVISRNSTEQYRETTKSASEIAEEMEVGNILSGSVQQSGDKVRINVQLTQGTSNQVVWSESYDRDLQDVFDLQSEIAQTVATQMQAILSSETRELIEKRPTDNLEAYEYYLKGQDIFNHAMSDNEVEASAPFFHKALELDPNFAECYVSLAGIYSRSRQELNNTSQEVQDSVFSLLDMALRLDPDLPEAYRFKGWYTFYVHNDREMVINYTQKALALDPNDWESLELLGYSYLYMSPPDYEKAYKSFSSAEGLVKGDDAQSLLEMIGFLHLGVGNFDKAEEYYLKAIDLNPNTADYNRIWWLLFVQGKYDEAMAWAEKSYAMYPEDMESVSEIARTYLYMGEYEKSEEYYDMWRKMRDPGEYGYYLYNVYNTGLGFAYYKLGKEELAKDVFQARIEHGRELLASGYWDGAGGELYEQARVQAVLGNREKAYEYLREFEKSEFGWGSLYWLNTDPMFENLRGEEEFQRILNNGFQLKQEIRDKLSLMEQNEALTKALSR